MHTKQLYLPILAIILLYACNNDLGKRIEILAIDEKWKNGKLEEAKREINTYLGENPGNEFAWTLLGHIESDTDHDSVAMAAYKKALDVNPRTDEAIIGLGILSRKKGEYGKAADYYYRALEIDPNSADAYSSLVVINLKRKEFKKAVEVGLKAFELDGNDATIAANLAAAYHYANDTIQREKYFDIAKENGYRNLEALREVFKGEASIFD